MMIYRFFVLCLLLFVLPPVSLFAGGRSEPKKTPDVPGTQGSETPVPPPPLPVVKTGVTLAGTNEGLFSVDLSGRSTALWTGGSVKKILPLVGSSQQAAWATMGSEGVMVSNDLRRWEHRNEGLPVKTIKTFQHREKGFLQIVQELKDLEINPSDPHIMVTATKDRVYLSRNQGRSWTSLGFPSSLRANGIKAVAVANMPRAGGGASGISDLTVFFSHSINGVHFIQPDRPNAQWAEINNGIEKLETTTFPDEVADIAVVLNRGAGIGGPEIFVSQTFRRRVYRLNWAERTFDLVWSDKSPFGTVDSLFHGQNSLYFLQEGTAASLGFSDYAVQKLPDIAESIRAVSMQAQINCAVIEKDRNSSTAEQLVLSELWLLNEIDPEQPRLPGQTLPQSPLRAANKEGLFLPVNHATDRNDLRRYLNIIERTGLNMIVIDMKDEYGRLRFTPHNPEITAKGRVFRPVDLESFLPEMKNRGIFTVARVVVFKDQELYQRENGRFAVWDSRHNRPWNGYYDRRRRTSSITTEERNNRFTTFFPTDDPEFEIVRTMYDERWVDPYSEEVWEYIAAISQELYERGIDEIQFDYIRFPTDGDNLGDARYRWRDSGMDTESAILSFLRHVRSRVSAPISIDIYGANGWYRTGSRTGQEVELLAPWVDIICPMYYPNHFEQHFLAQYPAVQRPWRIYFHGTLRNARIARGQVIIRPWVQAFFLNVSYDRQYYGGPLGTAENYVRLQIQGVREAGNGGFTHWNNSGRYDDIPDK